MSDVSEFNATAGGQSERSRALAPSVADIWVGHRVKIARLETGRSLAWLADEIGVSKNQLMKFEGGDNRLTCGRLYDIANALDRSPAWFFADIPGSRELAEPTADVSSLLKDAETIDFIRLRSQLTREQQMFCRQLLENLAAGNAAITSAAFEPVAA
jgi:transcriptional regulator with XRE-family HTH domain